MTLERAPLLNIRPEEKKLVFSLAAVLAITTLVLELSDVIATGGFVSKVGPNNIFWLWIVDMVISLFTAGVYALAVDRMERSRLLKYLTMGFAVIFIGLYFMFTIGAPDWLSYPVLYIVTDQFYAIFPLAFWAMVNDLFTAAEGKRIFPIIIMGTAIGSILGNGLAALSGWILQRSGGVPSSLLPIGSLLLLFGLIVLEVVFANRKVNARQAREQDVDLKQTVAVGVDYIKNVPIFKYLAICMLLSGLAFTVIEYHFLFTVDQSVSQDPLQFQAFYGIFKVVLIVSILLVQALFSNRFLEKVGLKSSFIFQPVALALGAGLALVVPGVYGAAAARYVARLVQQAWDEPARKAVENLIPDERRGRVSVVIDRYFYDVSTIVASLVLGLLVWIGLNTSASPIISYIYIGLAILASVVAVWAAFRLRAKYDESLLDWRLSRSRRKSVLSGIEF